MSRQSRNRWSPAEIIEIQAMRQQLMRYDEIGRHFGVSGQAIINALHRRGLTRGRLPAQRLSEAEPGSRKWYRLKAGMTIDELCKRSWVTKGAIIRWEKGGNIVHIDAVRAVCKVLGCTVSQYLGYDIMWGKGSRQ